MSTKKKASKSSLAPQVAEPPAAPEVIPDRGIDMDAALEENKKLEASLLGELAEARPAELLDLAKKLQEARADGEELLMKRAEVTRSAEWGEIRARHDDVAARVALREGLVISLLRRMSAALYVIAEDAGELQKLQRRAHQIGLGGDSLPDLPVLAILDRSGVRKGDWDRRLSNVAFNGKQGYQEDETWFTVSFRVPFDKN